METKPQAATAEKTEKTKDTPAPTEKAESPAVAKPIAEAKNDTAAPETTPDKSVVNSLLGRTALDSSLYKLRKSVTTAISRSPKARTYTVAILTIVTVVFFLVFTIIPTVTTIGELQTQLTQKQETLTSLKENVERIENHESAEKNNPEEYDALHVAVPEDLDESLFRQNVAAMAEKYNLSLVSIRFSPDYSKAVEGMPVEFRRVDTTMTFTGDINGFISLLEHLENNYRLFLGRNATYLIQDNLTTETKELRIRGDIYLVKPQQEWQTMLENQQNN